MSFLYQNYHLVNIYGCVINLFILLIKYLIYHLLILKRFIYQHQPQSWSAVCKINRKFFLENFELFKNKSIKLKLNRLIYVVTWYPRYFVQ